LDKLVINEPLTNGYKVIAKINCRIYEADFLKIQQNQYDWGRREPLLYF